MRQGQPFIAVHSWVKPVLLVIFTVLATAACKTQGSVSAPGGIPAPPGGGTGMPAPPGGPPAPPGGPPAPPGGSSGPSGGMPPSPMPGDSDGQSGSSSGSQGSEGSSGEVGSFPGGGDESAGVPPPPSSRGGGSEDGSESGEPGSEGGSGEPSEWEDDQVSDSECGDSGGMPGGIGGMGQDGECAGGGGGDAASESGESGESASAGGGSAEGEGVQGTGGAGSVGEFPEESDAERAERLGRELEKSVGGFDEVLQEEQREVASVGRNTEGFSGAAGQGAGDGGISLGEQGSGSNNPVSVANTGIMRESPIDAMSQDEIRERTPDDIPMVVDDDIIARQLREAALAEDDPALRERLWEEYRKYSGN